MALAAVRSKAVVLLLLLIHRLLLTQSMLGFVFVPSLVIKYLMSFLILQTSRLGREG